MSKKSRKTSDDDPAAGQGSVSGSGSLSGNGVSAVSESNTSSGGSSASSSRQVSSSKEGGEGDDEEENKKPVAMPDTRSSASSPGSEHPVSGPSAQCASAPQAVQMQQEEHIGLNQALVELGEVRGAFMQEIQVLRGRLGDRHDAFRQEIQALGEVRGALAREPQALVALRGRSDTLDRRIQELERAMVLREAFGAGAWWQYLGEVGKEPPLPDNIAEIWNGPCPFWRRRKVKDTHLLVLIPAAVDSEPFSLNLLGELVQHPRGGGYAARYDSEPRIFEVSGAQSPSRSYWVLMTRDVLEGSRCETYASQKALVGAHAVRTGLPYELPRTLEAATAILSHYVRSGKRLYSDSPLTYTRCQEQVRALPGDDEDGEEDEDGGEGCERAPRYHGVVVGNFREGGLDLNLFFNSRNGADPDYGVAGLRRLELANDIDSDDTDTDTDAS